MKILILYFSGTGNTQFIASKVNDELEKLEFEVELVSVEKFMPENTNKFDVIIIGYPIYACDMPLFLQDYMNNLTLPSTKKVIMFSTMGFYEGNASRKIFRRFREIGLEPIHFERIKMPGSDGLVFLKKDSKIIKKLLAINYNKSEKINRAVDNIVNKVQTLTAEKIPTIKYGGLVLGGLMDVTFKLIEGKFKKKFWVDDKCIKCHLCETICPAKNITVTEDKVNFSDKCYLCMRCINQCPTEAIQIGSKTKDKFRWKGPSGNYKPIK